MKDRPLSDLARRGFLIRCCEGAAAFFLPSPFSHSIRGSPGPSYHLQPHYREKTAVDAAALLIEPGADAFTAEVHAQRIEATLKRWTDGLLGAAPDVKPIGADLSDRFQGADCRPSEQKASQTNTNSLATWRCRYPQVANLNRESFLDSMRSALGDFSRLLTAEIRVTRIEVRDSVIRSQLRYELAGAGAKFHRESRLGEWTLEWVEEKVIRWTSGEEIGSRAVHPLFVEITDQALRGCSSFPSQLLRGADDWRNTLDAACGIDIYGHNGVCAAEIDGSGRDSIYVCQPAGLPNRLYLNRGDGSFEDVTERSGLGLLDNTACALFADFRNSGRQDVVVVCANGPLLFLNEGDGQFRLKEDAFRFATPPQGTFTGAAAADYDRDGRLDIYFCLYTFYQGTDQYRSPTPYFAAENGPPNFLMHNNGDGTFQDATERSGLNKNNTRYSFCCAWGDSNGDGWPDLYVVNDFGRKNLYRNNADGTFNDIAAAAGVEDVGAGMSVCWFDSRNDGREDLYVANMWTAAGERITNEEPFQRDASAEVRAFYRKHAMGNSLYVNDGKGGFHNRTDSSHTAVGRWSWSSDAWDFDHDGRQDLYIANGMISGPIRQDLNNFFWRQVVAKSPNAAISSSDYEAGWSAINEWIRSGYSWSGYERNVFYRNDGDGAFSDISGASALDFFEDSRSFALGDFDGDGRQEMLLKNRNAPQIRMIRNIIPDLPAAISFRLRGVKSNRDAIGARITVRTSAGQQTKYVQAGSGFLSQHSKEIFFGLGETAGKVTATIAWPSGRVQGLADLPASSRISVIEGEEHPVIEAFSRPAMMPVQPNPATVPARADVFETWLLCPIAAPNFEAHANRQPLLLCFSRQAVNAGALRTQVIDPDLPSSEDLCATYNLLFRHLFDAHRDLPLPSAFLLDGEGQVVKIYAGAIPVDTARHDSTTLPATADERLARALPFAGVRIGYQYGRNYLSLGSVFFQRGFYEASAGFFRSALKSAPDSAEAYYGLGSAYLKQNESARAAESFQKAVSFRPAYPETGPNAWNNLGLLAIRDGDTTKAIDCFQQALKLDPNHVITLENLGNAYRQEKQWDDARSALQRALSIQPDAPEANYGLAMIYAEQDDTDRAYDYLRKALNVKPDYPEALNNLGILYLRTRRPAQAVEAFEKCIRVAPTFDQSYLNLARVYAIEGDTQRARTVLTSLLAQHPEHARAKQALAELNQ